MNKYRVSLFDDYGDMNNGILDIKDKGLFRSEDNKRFRRVNWQRVKQGKDPRQMYEIVNPYDVCDYIFYWKNRCSIQYHDF